MNRTPLYTILNTVSALLVLGAATAGAYFRMAGPYFQPSEGIYYLIVNIFLFESAKHPEVIGGLFLLAFLVRAYGASLSPRLHRDGQVSRLLYGAYIACSIVATVAPFSFWYILVLLPFLALWLLMSLFWAVFRVYTYQHESDTARSWDYVLLCALVGPILFYFLAGVLGIWGIFGALILPILLTARSVYAKKIFHALAGIVVVGFLIWLTFFYGII